jgi:RecB family endonuclease NucS
MDKKVLIRRFTQEGFTLRPECVTHLLEYFQGLLAAGKKHKKELTTEESEPFLERIIENVRVLADRTGGVIVEEETMKGAIDLLQRPSNNNTT